MSTQITISVFYFVTTVFAAVLLGGVVGYFLGFTDGKKRSDDDE